jgi:hypothetical protein
VKVRISDGHGMSFEIAIDIWVKAPVEVPDPPPLPDPPPVPSPSPLPDPQPVPDPPALPSPPPVPDPPAQDPPAQDPPGQDPAPEPPAQDPPAPTEAPGPPVSPFQPGPPLPTLQTTESGGSPSPHRVRRLVQQALGTRGVRRLRNAGGAQVWARSQVSRRDLLRYGRAPGLVVVCLKGCQISSSSTLAPALRRSLNRARGKTVIAATAGQAQVLSLAITPAERRALRRTRRARAKFSVSVRAGGRRAASLRRSIPLTR